MIALYLIAAHLAGDFLFQTQEMAARKFTSALVRAEHVTVYTACCGVALVAAGVTPGWRTLSFLGAVWCAHFLTDSKRWRLSNPWPPMPILHDQALHAVQLATLAGICFA